MKGYLHKTKNDMGIRVIVADIETMVEYFLCTCYDPQLDEWHEFECNAWTNNIDSMVRYFEEKNDHYFVFYNGLRFDSQVLQFIINNHEDWHEKARLEICQIIQRCASDTIDDSNYGLLPKFREFQLSFKILDLFEIHHYSNKNRMVSLKRLEFEMDLEDIEEMPIHHTKINMTSEEIQLTKEYCKNDVMATYEFYKITTGDTEHPLYKGNNQIALRQDIQEEFGIPCLNYSDSKIGDEMIKKYYCQEKSIQLSELPKKGTFRKEIAVKNCIANHVQFQTPELQAFFKRVKGLKLGLMDDFKEEIHFYDNVYSFMKGGLHTENKPKVFEADEDHLIIDWDVSSYYPAIIINSGKYPAHLGKEFLRGYKQMFEKRLELKPLAKKDKKIAGIVGALKLAVNSVYGKSSDMQSWIYDRQLTMFTTITGELSLMMLIEAYELQGLHVISANTDGVTIMIHKDDVDKMHNINKWWMDLTQYELERTDYAKIIFSTVNDYLAIKTDGEIKKKGDFLTDFELHKNKSGRITSIALEQYYVNNVPVETTIKNHTNIFDFAIRQKASKSFHYEGINNMKSISISKEEMEAAGLYESIDGQWMHVGGRSVKDVINELKVEKLKKQPRNIYNKLIRYYVSNTGEKLLKIKNEGCDTNAAAVSQVEAGEWMCTVCNHLTKDHSMSNINYDYYIEKANRIVSKIQLEGKKRKVVVIANQMSLF